MRKDPVSGADSAVKTTTPDAGPGELAWSPLSVKTNAMPNRFRQSLMSDADLS